MDQSFSEGSIQSEGYCSNSILQNCLRNTGCAKDYRDVFLQTAKALGAQKTALLSLANLAAKQAGKSGNTNVRDIIAALGKYSRAQAVAHSAHTAAAPSSDKSSSGPAAAAAAIVVIAFLLAVVGGALGYTTWPASSEDTAGLDASHTDPGANFGFANPAHTQGPAQAAATAGGGVGAEQTYNLGHATARGVVQDTESANGSDYRRAEAVNPACSDQETPETPALVVLASGARLTSAETFGSFGDSDEDV